MKTDDFAAELHRAEFHRQALSAATAFDLALHSAKPAGKDQTEHEIRLAGYGRISIPRDSDHWAIDGHAARNSGLIRFPTIRAGTATATWLSIGIGGQIRRLVSIKEPIELAANRRAEFEPGKIEINDQ